MKFLFLPRHTALTKQNISNLTLDILQLIYYYKFEAISDTLREILSEDKINSLRDDYDIHIRDLNFIINLLTKLGYSKLNRNEKLALEDHIHEAMVYEMNFFDKNTEIKDFDAMKSWSEFALSKYFKNEAFI